MGMRTRRKAREEVTSRPQLETHERMMVISLSDHGWSIREIAEFIERSAGAVQHILEKWKKYQLIENRSSPRSTGKVTDAHKKFIKEAMEGQLHQSLRKMSRKLRQKYNIKLSHVAISDILHSWGWVPHHRRKTCILTRLQVRKRLTWCGEFAEKKEDYWRKVIFVDEKNFGEYWSGNPKNDIVWGP